MNFKTHFVIDALAIVGLAIAGKAKSRAESVYEPYSFTTIAGKAGATGSVDGTNSVARFNTPNGLAVDGTGNIFVPDQLNNTIRKVTPVGTNWVVTTVAGRPGNADSTDGPGDSAGFYGPASVVLDKAGNIFVADQNNSTIRKIMPIGVAWVVTTVAGQAGEALTVDGISSDARFNNPDGIAMDSLGNLYVVDAGDNTIRKITPMGANWMVTTLAGLAGHAGSADGANSNARFNGLGGVVVDSAGNLYVDDALNNTIRKVAPVGTNWVVTTLAGFAGHAGSTDGVGSAARFNLPSALAMDGGGNLFVTDWNNHTIRKVAPVGTNWVVTTLAGQVGSSGVTDGTGSTARFNTPNGVAVDSRGNLYVSDDGNNTIRKGSPALMFSTFPSSLTFTSGRFGFDLKGPPGQSTIIEASSDLVNWLPVWTNLLAGPLSFSDPGSAGNSRGFYRARAR